MEGKRVARTTEASPILKALNKLATHKPTTKSAINELKFLYTNADCFSNKKSDLEVLLQTLCQKPDIIVITEVNPKRLVVGLQENEFSMGGYNMFTLNIGIGSCHGIIIYVKVNLLASQIEIITYYSECLFIKIKLVSYDSLTVGAFYRSPTGNATNNKELIKLMRKLNTDITGRFILLGDLNLSSINWYNYTSSVEPNSVQQIRLL